MPEGRLFGAFTTRGEGITQATYRYPKVVQAIHHLASLRGGEANSEGYLSAQVNRVKKMQVHKDKNNHSTSWLIALGEFTGGRLWLEDPLGQHPPPCVTSEWQKGLRGSYHNVHNTWFKFDPTQVSCSGGGQDRNKNPQWHCSHPDHGKGYHPMP